MAKRLTENQKKEIIKGFKNGKTIEYLLEEFNCSKLTIKRNLKKELGEEIYEELNKKNEQIYKSRNHAVGIEIDIETERSIDKSSNESGEIRNLDQIEYETNSLPFSESKTVSRLLIQRQQLLEINLGY